MKLLTIGLAAALAASNAQAAESYCIYPTILGMLSVTNTDGVMINEDSGVVMYRVEKLSSDLYLLKDGEDETAFRSKPTDFGYFLHLVSAEDIAIACFDDAADRDELLTLLEEAG